MEFCYFKKSASTCDAIVAPLAGKVPVCPNFCSSVHVCPAEGIMIDTEAFTWLKEEKSIPPKPGTLLTLLCGRFPRHSFHHFLQLWYFIWCKHSSRSAPDTFLYNLGGYTLVCCVTPAASKCSGVVEPAPTPSVRDSALCVVHLQFKKLT